MNQYLVPWSPIPFGYEGESGPLQNPALRLRQGFSIARGNSNSAMGAERAYAIDAPSPRTRQTDLAIITSSSVLMTRTATWLSPVEITAA